ncbi:alpha-N-acetylgalactosamine-specific lectin, partial [Biomphalaria pfeifferi]
LDDLANEGHFVWIDNGEEINPLLKPLLFDIYQPDNANGNEDCVYKRSLTDPHSLTLNDAPCSSNISYI